MKNLVLFCQNIQGLAIKHENKSLPDRKRNILLSNNRHDIIVITKNKTSKNLWIEGTSQEYKYYAAGYSACVIENGIRGTIILIRHGSNLNVKNIIVISPDILGLHVSSGANNLSVFGVYGTSRYDDE